MDVVLEILDRLVFDRLYATVLPAPEFSVDGNFTRAPPHKPYDYEPASRYLSVAPGDYVDASILARDDILRQTISLFAITCVLGLLLYFVFASLSYYFIFDHETFKHPRYLKNQIALEIKQSVTSVPGMAVLTVPFFLLEVRGYSKMYDSTEDGPGLWYNIAQFPLFFMFTDFGIYWIHRGLHHPRIYKHLHKAHHKWIMPTPYAAIAFHPVDGWAQSLPYHVYPLLFPLQKWAYVLLFVFIQIWTILIHDGEYVANNPLINGAACHSLHHFAFNYNYGQFFTLWDRIGGSYRRPAEEVFIKDSKMSKSTWTKQTQEADAMMKTVEGVDSREYVTLENEKKKQ